MMVSKLKNKLDKLNKKLIMIIRMRTIKIINLCLNKELEIFNAMME
jgi:hypothetical protein